MSLGQHGTSDAWKKRRESVFKFNQFSLLVEDMCGGDLEKEVNEKMSEGYVPQGGVCIVSPSILAQAMVLRKCHPFEPL